MPGAPAYTNADAARVVLLRSLERTYSATPTLRDDGKDVPVVWMITKGMVPAKLQTLMFPQLAAPATPTTDAPAPKRRKLGAGAYKCTAAPVEGVPLLLGPQPATPVLQEQPQALLELTDATTPAAPLALTGPTTTDSMELP